MDEGRPGDDADRESEQRLEPPVDGSTGDALQQGFGRSLGRLGSRLLAALDALEQAFRRLHPPDLPQLGAALTPVQTALAEALADFERVTPPPVEDERDGDDSEAALARLREDLLAAGRRAGSALAALTAPGEVGTGGVAGVLGAMHDHARAQALLYPLAPILPPVSAWFAESFARDDPTILEPRTDAHERVGLFRSGEPGARGGFDLYVPEHYDGREAWPLVVALHGGSGRGEDFLWSWLREARSGGCLLLAPTSEGSTWSLDAPERDGRALREATFWVASQWRVDRERVLLTGLSDGATMSLLVGLGADAPWTHLAPVSGVLHPANFRLGNLSRARGRPVYLVHGTLDWMFPVTLARRAAEVLEEAGAALVYRELADLSHTYPREENARILEWLDPRRRPDALDEAPRA